MKSFTLKLYTAIFILGYSVQLIAAVSQSVTLPLSVKVDDNPRFTITGKQAITRITLTPSYNLSSNQETNSWYLNASLFVERSSDESIVQNRDDPTLKLGWTHKYETGQFSVSGLSSDQSTRITEFSDSGLVSGDNTRKTGTLSANWLNQLNEKSSLNIAVSTTEVNFEGLSTAGLIDYRSETINAKLNRTLSEKLESFLSLSSSRYTPDILSSANETTTNTLDIGLSWKASEQLNFSVSAGLNETKYKNNIQPGNKRGQAALDIQYNTLRTNTLLNLSRSQSPSSLGGVNEANQITAGWTYSLTEKDSFSLNLNWRENLTLNKSKAKLISANYTHQMSLFWNFRLSVVRQQRDSSLSSASNNSIMTSIIYTLPEI